LGWLARLRISALQDSREEGFWNNHLGDRRDTSALGDYPFSDLAIRINRLLPMREGRVSDCSARPSGLGSVGRLRWALGNALVSKQMPRPPDAIARHCRRFCGCVAPGSRRRLDLQITRLLICRTHQAGSQTDLSARVLNGSVGPGLLLAHSE
jgi:hypothetical protein